MEDDSEVLRQKLEWRKKIQKMYSSEALEYSPSAPEFIEELIASPQEQAHYQVVRQKQYKSRRKTRSAPKSPFNKSKY